MAEPAWRRHRTESDDPEGDTSFVSVLQRWVERPDGRLELIELPLTPELFLDPQLEDKMVQGELHADLMAQLKELVGRHFHDQRDVKVLMDVKHLLGPGLPGPAPDISVVRGVRNPARKRDSFNVVKEGVVPCLIIEIVSPLDARIRRTDEVDKVALYQRIGVQEYLLVEPPRKATANRFRLKGYRLGPDRRYRPLEPDREGRLLSETTELLFGVSAAGDRIDLFDATDGERMQTPVEIEEARKAAESELARLRAEIERLKISGR